MIFKCKMCGGTVEFEPGASTGICDSCGTKQTLPRLDDDKRANLYDRANHFRRNNDFDKAMAIYEQILNEDNTDAEAYWSLVLCRYGIEYVEDPQSRKRVPTVNRAQFTSIYMDEDYKSALQYADGYQKTIYEEEAKAIDDIQKGILEISSKEDPFDVFICYKETDANGRRTPDSVLANDLYHQLTQEGFKVFFARITLEDKLGSAYEPYIFAALNSAKVMVVLGTKPEYFNAVWVRNEWSRYLALVKKSGGKRILIPAYKDMDPYDLPEEFSHLQAQDMSKLGFMQDLIRGIKKIVEVGTAKAPVKETVAAVNGNANVDPLLERAFLFLEDGKWQDANTYCEKVLDIDPKNAEAYLGKLMAELQVKKRELLADCKELFDGYDNFGKVIRFGDEKLETEMRGYIAHIKERNEIARLEGIYNKAAKAMEEADTEKSFQTAAEAFGSVRGFKDADLLAEKCLEKAEVCRKDSIYGLAEFRMGRGTIEDYKAAINYFRAIPGWKDADKQIDICQRKTEELEQAAEQRRIAAEKTARKYQKIVVIALSILLVCVAFLPILQMVIIPKHKLNKAMKLLDSGDYETAYSILEEISNSDAIASSKYDRAVSLIDSGNYEAAYILLNGLDYKDSANKLMQIKEFDGWMEECPVGGTFFFGSYEQDNNTLNGKEDIEWLVLAKDGSKTLVISKYALDCRQYNTSDNNVTWERCSLRKWMNSTFLKNAFSKDERSRILDSKVTPDKNPKFGTNAGNTTTDKVFLLSITEVEIYLGNNETRECALTVHAKARGAWTSDNHKTVSGEATCCWWLRSPGETQRSVVTVNAAGSVLYFGDYAISGDECVRPAMWINLEP